MHANNLKPLRQDGAGGESCNNLLTKIQNDSKDAGGCLNRRHSGDSRETNA